jgi:diguanylate cyclase (GGDEF)-like protein
LVTLRTLSAAVREAFARDDRIAHLLGGVMFMAGGLATVAWVLWPGDHGSHESLALLVGIVGLVYGFASAFLLPWEKLPFLALHAAGATSLVIVGATASWTGGHDSPIRFLAIFVVVWAACFCRPREVVVYVVLASGTFLLPLLIGDGHDEHDVASFVREQAVILPALAAVALNVVLLQRSQLRAQARAGRAADQQRSLLRVATAVADGLSGDALSAVVAEEAASVFGADAGVTLRFEDQGAVVTGAWTDGLPLLGAGFVVPWLDGTPLKLARDGVRAVHTGRDDVQIPQRLRDLGYLEMAVAPIEFDGRVWGAVSVASVSETGLPENAGVQLAEFGALVTTALANAEQRDLLAAQAFSDPLTGLANHRSFHERLEIEVARAERHGRELSLVLLDVDTFKSINDSAGHEVGDRVLAEVAERLQAVGRSGDLLARIGGDEFGWLLPETAALDALAVVERGRAAVAGRPVVGDRRVTLSAGICDLGQARDGDDLFRLADGALYWSKAHGRDAAHVYDPETVRELSAAERAEQLARHQALLGIRALARAIDAKDPTTREHSGRVAKLVCALARGRGWGEERIRLMEEAALVHDVGKIGIADAILLKPGRLDDAEYAEVKRHAALGAQIVEDVLTPEQVTWIRGHHERPDGRGYPDGLTAPDITEGATLLALADAFDVMTAARPYATPKTHAEALAECRTLVGAQFTAEAVAALEALEAPSAPMLAS